MNTIASVLIASVQLTSVPLSTAFAEPGPEQATLDCTNGKAIFDAWTPAREAYRAGDNARAKPILDAIIAACPMTPLADGPRVMRADIAVSEKDYAGSLRTLGDMARPATNRLGALPSFIALSATAGVGDGEGYARERQWLADGIERRLTDPDGAVKAKLVERFNVGSIRVAAFEGDYQNGAFIRHMTFVIQGAEPFAPLRTIMLSSDPVSDMIDGQHAFFLDQYTCREHETLEIIAKRKPGYKTVREKVERHLQEPGGSISRTEGGGAEMCGFSDYVAPGFAVAE